MDVVSGIYFFREESSNSQYFSEILKTSSIFSSTESKVWSSDDECFNVCSSHGQLNLSSELVVVGTGKGFSLYDTPVNTKTVPCLVKDSFVKEGLNFAPHLIGDWTGIIFNKAKKELILLNGSGSYTSLFYYFNEDFIAFSSMMKPLLELKCIPKVIDKRAAANLLITNSFYSDETLFKGIKALKTGHSFTIKPNSKLPELKIFWKPKVFKQKKQQSNDEIINEFVQLFKHVIGERINTEKKTGLALSGGLDSAAIAALGSDYLAEQKKKLYTFTFIKLFQEFQIDDERWYKDEEVPVKQIIDHVGNIEPYFTQSKESHHLDTIDLLIDKGILPPYQIISIPWLLDLINASKEQGMEQLIVGMMGNSTVSFRGTDEHTKANLKQKVRYILPEKISEPLLRLIRPKQYVNWKRNSFLNELFFTGLESEGHWKKVGFSTTHGERIKPDAFLRKEMKLDFGRSGELIKELSVISGMNITDPTYDPRIIEFCLNIPHKVFGSKKRNRLLIRDGFKGLLPEEILDNPKRGRQVGDLFERMRLDFDRLKLRFEETIASPIAKELLDLDRLTLFIEKLERNETCSIFECNAFLRSIGLISYLERYSTKTN